MKITKKILGIAMSALCSVSVIAGGSSFSVAEAVKYSSEYTDGNLKYVKVDFDEDGTYDYVQITGCVDGAETVNIPPTEESLPVKDIAAFAFGGADSLYDITVSSSNSYFSADGGVLFNKDKTTIYCYPMGKKGTSYSIPSGVATVGIGTFYNCANLTEIKIPNSVTAIDGYAFYNCAGLTSISLGNVQSVGNNAFSGTGIMNNQIINKTGPLYYADTWVIACDSDITSVMDESTPIKAGTKGIADYAFYDSNKLAKVVIPESVLYIGASSFANCSELSSLSIPSKVTSIGNNAFESCVQLTELIIPDSVKTIGIGAFNKCSKLTTIQLPANIKTIENSVFKNCTSLVSVDIPSSVTSIGAEAFYGCLGLTNITIKNAKCEIYDHPNTISDTATIYGYAGSTAETYATNFKRTFSELAGQSGLRGDANEDGVVNVRDAAFIARKLAEQKISELPDFADYNNDGTVNVRDAAAIARDLANGVL